MDDLRAKFELEFRADGSLIIKTGDQVATIGTKADKAKSKVDLLTARLDKLGKGLNRAAGMTGRLTLGFTALLAGLAMVLKKVVDAAMEVESVHTRLLTVYRGNQQMADDMLEWAKEFAATTPYQLQQVSSATATLEMLGLSAKRWLPLVGDLAAAMGKDIEETAMGVGRAVASGGASLSILSRSYAITAQQLKEAGWSGVRSVDAVGDALERLLKSGRTAGGMERLSHTFEGMVSNLKDQVFMLLSEVGQPLLEILRDDIGALLARINEMKRTGEWDKWIKKISGFLERFLDSAKTVGAWLGKLLVQVVEFIDKNPQLAEFAVKLATIGPIAGGVTTAVLRLAGAAVTLTSNLIKATKAGGALSKLGGYLSGGKVGGAGAGWLGAGAAAVGIIAVIGTIAKIAGMITAWAEADARRAETAKALASMEQTYNQIQQDRLTHELEMLRVKESIFGRESASLIALSGQKKILEGVNREEQARLELLQKQAEAGLQGMEGARLEISRLAGEMQGAVGFGEFGPIGSLVAQDLARRAEVLATQGDLEGLLDLGKRVSDEFGGESWAPTLIGYLQQMTQAAEGYSNEMLKAGRTGFDIARLADQQKSAMDAISKIQQALTNATGTEKRDLKALLETRLADLRARSGALQIQAQLLEAQLAEMKALYISKYMREGLAMGEGALEALYGQISDIEGFLKNAVPDLSFDTTNEVTNETAKSGGDSRPAIQIRNDYRYITVQRAVLDVKRGTEDEVVELFSELASSGGRSAG